MFQLNFNLVQIQKVQFVHLPSFKSRKIDKIQNMPVGNSMFDFLFSLFNPGDQNCTNLLISFHFLQINIYFSSFYFSLHKTLFQKHVHQIFLLIFFYLKLLHLNQNI